MPGRWRGAAVRPPPTGPLAAAPRPPDPSPAFPRSCPEGGWGRAGAAAPRSPPAAPHLTSRSPSPHLPATRAGAAPRSPARHFASLPPSPPSLAPDSLGGVDPDDVEVAVVDALLVFVGVASAAPGSPPQRPAVSPGPAAAARRRRRRLAALPLLPAQRRRARLAAGRHGARPGQRGPCKKGRGKSRAQRSPCGPLAPPTRLQPPWGWDPEKFRAAKGTVMSARDASTGASGRPGRGFGGFNPPTAGDA